MYNISVEGKGTVKNLLLIDKADVEIIKLNFQGMFIDISIKQVSFKWIQLFLPNRLEVCAP